MDREKIESLLGEQYKKKSDLEKRKKDIPSPVKKIKASEVSLWSSFFNGSAESRNKQNMVQWEEECRVIDGFNNRLDQQSQLCNAEIANLNSQLIALTPNLTTETTTPTTPDRNQEIKEFRSKISKALQNEIDILNIQNLFLKAGGLTSLTFQAATDTGDKSIRKLMNTLKLDNEESFLRVKNRIEELHQNAATYFAGSDAGLNFDTILETCAAEATDNIRFAANKIIKKSQTYTNDLQTNFHFNSLISSILNFLIEADPNHKNTSDTYKEFYKRLIDCLKMTAKIGIVKYKSSDFKQFTKEVEARLTQSVVMLKDKNEIRSTAETPATDDDHVDDDASVTSAATSASDSSKSVKTVRAKKKVNFKAQDWLYNSEDCVFTAECKALSLQLVGLKERHGEFPIEEIDPVIYTPSIGASSASNSPDLYRDRDGFDSPGYESSSSDKITSNNTFSNGKIGTVFQSKENHDGNILYGRIPEKGIGTDSDTISPCAGIK